MGEPQDRSGSVTQVEGYQLEVQASYVADSCNGPAGFQAVIPTAYDIQPFTSQRMQLEIDELPISKGNMQDLRSINFGAETEVLPLLHKWSQLEVFLWPRDTIYPSGLTVRHDKENASMHPDDSIYRALNK
jgi:hypothetical protein